MEFNVNTDYYEKLGPTRLYVYSYLKENPGSTREQAIKDLRMAERTFRSTLNSLVDEGYLKQVYVSNEHKRSKMIGVEVLK